MGLAQHLPETLGAVWWWWYPLPFLQEALAFEKICCEGRQRRYLERCLEQAEPFFPWCLSGRSAAAGWEVACLPLPDLCITGDRLVHQVHSYMGCSR